MTQNSKRPGARAHERAGPESQPYATPALPHVLTAGPVGKSAALGAAGSAEPSGTTAPNRALERPHAAVHGTGQPRRARTSAPATAASEGSTVGMLPAKSRVDIGSNDVVAVWALLPDGQPISVKGREAWALAALTEAGAVGVTPRDRPAPRWSCYVHRLRSRGLDIETRREPHGGAYAGRHGRYVLKTALSLVDITRAGGRP